MKIRLKNIIKSAGGTLVLAFSFFILSNSINGYRDPQKEEKLSMSISRNDSIVADIITIIIDGQNLDSKRKKAIESQMRNFPGKVIRRDTATFFLQTALEIAYYNYIKEDETSAKNRAANFLTNVQESNPLKVPMRFGLMKFTGISIPEMGAKQKKIHFLESLLRELPLNLNIDTYTSILTTLKTYGALYAFFDSPIEYNFIDKCIAGNRTDILKCIEDIWEIQGINGDENNETTEYETKDSSAPDSLKLETDRIKQDFYYTIIDAYGNLDVIDSLININQLDSIGKYMNNFQNITFQRGELRALIENSKKYENFIPIPWRVNFYDMWGVAHSYLGEHEDAIGMYNKALEYVDNDVAEAIINMNMALSICESGDIDSAISKINKYKDTLNHNGNGFQYLDALAYIVGHIDKEKAAKLYEEADILLDRIIDNENITFRYGVAACLTRHFVREARLCDNDLFKWRNALSQARHHSGVDSYFGFFKDLPRGLYFSELGRFRSFLFDPAGMNYNFEKANIAFEDLDSCDYRVRWMKDCRNDVVNYAPSPCSPDEIIKILQANELSPLHNIWLCLNLGYHISQHRFSDVNIINFYLHDNIAEALFALPSDDSKFLADPLRIIQGELLIDELLCSETENLANLNLLRKGLTQSSKGLLEKNLSKYNPESYNILVKLRRDLNTAYAYEDSLKVKKLLPEILQKESELYYAVKDSIDLGAFIGTTVESVSSQLGQDEIAIDFVCSQTEDSFQIGAFIIQQQQPTEFVRLKHVPLSEESDVREELYDIWEPLQPFLENKRNIYFSPDGILLNLGIEFFPSSKGTPILYAYNIHRVSHLREIKNGEYGINGEIALIGISDHNSPIGEGETIYRGNWVDMPGVRNEIENIDLVLNKFPHTIYFNDNATEEAINELNGNNISVLHFSTHGVYRDLNSLAYSLTDPSHFDYNIAKRILKTDRQSICGLVLRGGNISWKIPHILEEADDILTDDEIENMNFPELRLTVLSACSTALGDIDSDGIQGLQRAFRVAGSKNIICSLREVNDYWTEQFMVLLYQNLANGCSIYDSFRNAHKSLYDAEPDKNHVWSSFILIE